MKVKIFESLRIFCSYKTAWKHVWGRILWIGLELNLFVSGSAPLIHIERFSMQPWLSSKRHWMIDESLEGFWEVLSESHIRKSSFLKFISLFILTSDNLFKVYFSCYLSLYDSTPAILVWICPNLLLPKAAPVDSACVKCDKWSDRS